MQITYVSSPVARGSNGLLVAQTVPGAQCSITINYSWGQAAAGGTADGSGQVAWSWLVLANETPGSYIIVVTATAGGLSGSQTVLFTVT